jgi:Uma2 family endonuclease
MTIHIINLKPLTQHISDRDFERLCASNPELKLETDTTGNLIVMSPTGSQSGKFNITLAFQIELWNRQSKLGIVFDSSTGFKLSNGAVRSPDVSWIEISRWNSLSDQQKRGFAPIEPDFVIELMSPTDDLLTIQKKMAEYINCGVKLGWLINPDEKQVQIYRISQEKEVINNPSQLSGENVLTKLTVDLREIFFAE